jgi:hypothetical protein
MMEENFDKKAMMAMILSFTDHGGFGIADSVFYTQPIPRPVVYQPFLQAGEKLFDSAGLNTFGAMVDKLGDLLPASSNRYVTLHPPLAPPRPRRVIDADLRARTTQLVYSFKNGPASLYTKLFQIWEEACTTLSESNIPALTSST